MCLLGRKLVCWESFFLDPLGYSKYKRNFAKFREISRNRAKFHEIRRNFVNFVFHILAKFREFRFSDFSEISRISLTTLLSVCSICIKVTRMHNLLEIANGPLKTLTDMQQS